MAKRRRSAKSKPKLLGSHQRCWLWGRIAVLETLRAAKWIPLELYLDEGLSSGEWRDAKEMARRLQIPVFLEPGAALQRRCRSAEHQGYVAKMPPFPYDDAERLLERLSPTGAAQEPLSPGERGRGEGRQQPAVSGQRRTDLKSVPRSAISGQRSASKGGRSEAPFYVLLDGIQDPFNFGAILRSADVLGVDAVFIGETGQVGVTSLVARSSAGAVNFVPISQVPDLVELADGLRSLAIQLVAATEKGDRNAFDIDLRLPTALVIGNEATGIRAELLALCDHRIRIPQVGHVAALNAAVSAGILFYEALRQRIADCGLRIED